ncbi:serine hydrolase [Enterococcus sp. LJL120]
MKLKHLILGGVILSGLTGLVLETWYNDVLGLAATVETTETTATTASEAATVTQLAISSEEDNQALTDYLEDVEEIISSYGEKSAGELSITYTDLTSGETISYNGETLYTAASTTKVPLVMYLSDQIDAGVLSWEDVIYYDDSYYESGTGTIQYDPQVSYTLAELAELAIVESDNIGTNMLYAALGGYDSTRSAYYLKYLGEDISQNENQITSDAAAEILSYLYEASADNDNYQTLIENMLATAFSERLETTETTGSVAHKIGSLDSDVHDIGIFYSEAPYIVTVYSEGVCDADQLIAELSDELWELQTTSYPN